MRGLQNQLLRPNILGTLYVLTQVAVTIVNTTNDAPANSLKRRRFTLPFYRRVGDPDWNYFVAPGTVPHSGQRSGVARRSYPQALQMAGSIDQPADRLIVIANTTRNMARRNQ